MLHCCEAIQACSRSPRVLERSLRAGRLQHNDLVEFTCIRLQCHNTFNNENTEKVKTCFCKHVVYSLIMAVVSSVEIMHRNSPQMFFINAIQNITDQCVFVHVYTCTHIRVFGTSGLLCNSAATIAEIIYMKTPGG